MPDFPVCQSTVCPVARNCAVNWSSGLKSDRPPDQQQWIYNHHYARKADPRSHDAFCAFYKPVDFEMAWKDEREAREMMQAAAESANDQASTHFYRLDALLRAAIGAKFEARKKQFDREQSRVDAIRFQEDPQCE